MTGSQRLALRLLLGCLPLLGWSQTGLTSLRGTVSDPSGALLADAQVTLEEPTTGFHATHNTDQSGAYEFLQITPGKYTITVSKAEFGRQVKAAELLVSQPATINFALSLKTINETIDVSDVAPTVNTTDATIGNAVSNSTIARIKATLRSTESTITTRDRVMPSPECCG